MKLLRKERVGSRVRRRYDAPRTPLDRLRACAEADPAAVARLVTRRDQLDPFELAVTIDRKLERLVARATPARAPTRPGVAFAVRPSRRHTQPPRPTHLHPFTFGNRLRRPVAPRPSVTS